MMSIFATTYSKWKKVFLCYLGEISALMVKYKKYLKKKKKKSQREQEGDFLAIPKQFSMIFCNHTKITFCN